MQVIAVVNQKGGVGKTTTTVNLAHAIALRDRRVTVIDLDPQGHLSPSLGLFNVPGGGVSESLSHQIALVEQCIEIRDWCDMIPSGDQLTEFEHAPSSPDRAYRLRDALQTLPDESDIVLIDCPPSSGMLLVNAVCAADQLMIPVAGDYLSLTGLARLLLTLKRLEPMCKSGMRKWIFLSRFISRRRLAREVHGKLLLHFSQILLDTSISEAAVLAECAGAGKTIFEYRPNSRSAQEYRDLADDLLNQRVSGNEQAENSHVA